MKGMKQMGAALLAAVLATGMTAFADASTDARYDGQVQSSVARELQKKSEFHGVRASVQDGIVTLEGSVDNLKAKLDAEKKVRKQDHVAGVRNLVDVQATPVSDAQLEEQISNKLRYEHTAGFFDNVFSNFAVGVKDGVVTLTGEAYTPAAKQDAIADIVNTKGVKGIVEDVKVSPASTFDDQLRAHLVRAIYGGVGPMYGMDPEAPIRIVVNNGRVGLFGVVNSDVDRTMAVMAARSTFGVFDVENHLATSKELAR